MIYNYNNIIYNFRNINSVLDIYFIKGIPLIASIGILMKRKIRSLFSRYVNKARELISFHFMTFIVTRKYLNHTRVIPGIVSRQWYPILHDPPIWKNLLCICYNIYIYPKLEFLTDLIHFQKTRIPAKI